MLVPTSDGYRSSVSFGAKLVWRGLDAELEDEPPNPDLRLLATPLTNFDAAPAAAFFAMFTKASLNAMSKYPYTLMELFITNVIQRSIHTNQAPKIQGGFTEHSLSFSLGT
jgi:hypothetical protein